MSKKNVTVFQGILHFLLSHKAYVLIAIFSGVLRYYDYFNRWGLAYDQAHDGIVARYALEADKIPLLGPFSSAGAFQTGGEWYWFIMAGTVVWPYHVITPWVILTLLYVLFVIFLMKIATDMEGKIFGLITGIIAAVSTAQITQGVNLTNQSPLSLTSLLAIWAMIKYVKKKEPKYLFLLSLFISIGASIHLQGTGLIMLLITTIIFTGIPSRKAIKYTIIGLFLPWIPVLIADVQNNFYNTRNMINYYLYDQYKISLESLERRWLTYLGIFWPTTWSRVTGGNIVLTYIVIVGSYIFALYSVLQRKLKSEWKIIFSSFMLILILLRYIRTPLFDSYIVFLHPLIFLITAFFVFSIFKKNKYIGIILLVVIVGVTLTKSLGELSGQKNVSYARAKVWRDVLVKEFPGKKFSLYDYKYRSAEFSLPLVLLLQTENKIADDGYKIGFGNPREDTVKRRPYEYSTIKGSYEFVLKDLNSSSSAELDEEKWGRVNPSDVYHSTEEWFRKK